MNQCEKDNFTPAITSRAVAEHSLSTTYGALAVGVVTWILDVFIHLRLDKGLTTLLEIGLQFNFPETLYE